jgi:hypothetical protein
MKLRKEMKEKEEEGNAKKEGTITSFFLFFQFHPYIFFSFLI